MEYYKIGKFVAAFGLKGELILKHTLGKKTLLEGLRAIFIEEKKDAFIPWFIESAKPKSNDEIYLKLEGINEREEAVRLTKKEVWIPEAEFKIFASASSPLNFLGYTIINDGNSLGKILEVIEQPQQLICRIEINGMEVLIPVNEETLKKIDRKKQQVIVSLPDGLLDIYLE